MIWIEDVKEYEKTWKTLFSLGSKEIYPAHGNPFSISELEKNIRRE